MQEPSIQDPLLVEVFNISAKDIIKYGTDQALLLSHIKYWVANNEASEMNKFDSLYWTYNSAENFRKIFPFWKRRKISRLLNDLEKDGAIISRQNKLGTSDQTKAYTVNKIPLATSDQSLATDDRSLNTNNKLQRETKEKDNAFALQKRYPLFSGIVNHEQITMAQYYYFDRYLKEFKTILKKKHRPCKDEEIQEYDEFIETFMDFMDISSGKIHCHMIEYLENKKVRSDKTCTLFCHHLYSTYSETDYRGFTAKNEKISIRQLIDEMNEVMEGEEDE